MSAPQTFPTVIRPPLAVIAVGLLWSNACFLFFIQAYGLQSFAHAIAALVSLVVTVGIFRGACWAYWTSAAALALSTGNTLLELQFRGYAHTSESVLWCNLVIGIGSIGFHQFSHCPNWFKVAPTKRHRLLFWLMIGGLIVAGQFIQPLVRDWLPRNAEVNHRQPSRFGRRWIYENDWKGLVHVPGASR